MKTKDAISCRAFDAAVALARLIAKEEAGRPDAESPEALLQAVVDGLEKAAQRAKIELTAEHFALKPKK
jgi:hypothetical protein